MRPQVFERRIKAVAAEVAEAKAALEQIKTIAVTRARDLAPVRTGNLRDSVAGRVEGNAVFLGTVVSYAPYVEYGTKYMKARPFMKQAIDENEGHFYEILQQYGLTEMAKVG